MKCIWCHNPEGISFTPQMAYHAHKCIRCGECQKVCPVGAQRIHATEHVFDRSICIACGACEKVCLGNAMKLYGLILTVNDALSLALEDHVFYRDTGGVTLSGGEPLLQADFAAELLRCLKDENVHTAVDTCGMVPWRSFEKVQPYTDMFLYDIKHINPERHRELTGQTNDLILENLQKLAKTGKTIEIRMPLVPGCNDDLYTLHAIGQLLSSLPISRMRVLPYHALARSKYESLGCQDTMPKVLSPSDEALSIAVSILKTHGVPAVSGRD